MSLGSRCSLIKRGNTVRRERQETKGERSWKPNVLAVDRENDLGFGKELDIPILSHQD